MLPLGFIVLCPAVAVEGPPPPLGLLFRLVLLPPPATEEAAEPLVRLGFESPPSGWVLMIGPPLWRCFFIAWFVVQT